MNTKQLVSITLALWLVSPLVAGAQSGWPGEKKTTTAPVASPAKSRRTTPKAKPASVPASRRRKAVSAAKTRVMTLEEATLRSMSQIIARQTLAIEALTVRLEAAERRLDGATAAIPEAPADEFSDPFRAARAVDWAQVIEERALGSVR